MYFVMYIYTRVDYYWDYYWDYNYNIILFSKSLYLELLRSDTRIPHECWSCCRCSDSRRTGIACRRHRDYRRTIWSDSRSTDRVRRARNRILRTLRLYYSPVAVSLCTDVFPRSSGNVTCSKLFDWLPRRGWRGNGRLASVDAILLAHEVILIPATSTVIVLSAMLLVGVVIPSLSVIATLTQKSG